MGRRSEEGKLWMTAGALTLGRGRQLVGATELGLGFEELRQARVTG